MDIHYRLLIAFGSTFVTATVHPRCNDLTTCNVAKLMERLISFSRLVFGAGLFLITAAAVGASTLEDGIKAYEAGDYQTAIEKWQTLIREGSPDGMYNLGVMYAAGRGVAQDKAKAFELYSQAAQQNHVLAQYNLGMQYATGEGVTQDHGKAAYWWTKAAEGGLMQAQFNLGTLYYHGQTGEKNPALARKWLTLAASQGSVPAKESLAKLDAEDARRPGLSQKATQEKVELSKLKGFAVRSVLTPDQRDVSTAVANWVTAWSRKDMNSYLAAYAKDFAVPGGRSREQWEAERRARIVGKSWIEVKVEGLEITVDGDIAKVRFWQSYRSDKLTENSNKTLTLVKIVQKWLIQQERDSKVA